MSKLNNKTTNNILLTLEILVISVISILAFSPTKTKADFYYYPQDNSRLSNPIPTISSIEPSSINEVKNKVTITITGSGFIPSSIVRKDSSNINSSFIDSNHILVDIYPNEIYNQNKFFLTVFNSEPDGGYSNALTFTIKNSITTNNNSTTYNNTDTINTNTTETNNTVSTNNTKENFNSLTANALMGSNSFMPNGLAQWIFFIIMIVAIIFLWRYVHRSEEAYMSEPMKHA